MSRVRARLFPLAAAALLAGCGAGVRSLPFSAPQSAPDGAVAASGRTGVTFSVKVAHADAPGALALTIDRGTPAQQDAALSLALGAPGCTSSGRAAPETCALVLDLAPGAHVLDVEGAGYAPLASVPQYVAGLPFTAVAGAANAVRLAFEGKPAGIAVLPLPGQDIQGTRATGFELYGFYKADGVTKFDRTFFIAATDAEGAYVVGAGAPSLELVARDPQLWSNGASTTPNLHEFTVHPVVYVPAATARFTVTAETPDGAVVSAPVQLSVAARNAPRVYVASHLGGPPCAGSSASGSISVYDEQGNPVEVPGAFTGLCGATGLAYVPALDRLYAAQEFGNAILAYDLDGNRVATAGGFPNVVAPAGIAYDAAHDRILAGNFDAALTAYDTDGVQLAPRGTWAEREGVAPHLPYGILADPRGARVYVADAGYNRIEAYDANGNALFAFPVRGGAIGIAQDAASGNLYVTDDDHAVHVFDPHGEPIVQRCSAGSYGCAGGKPWADARAPMGIAQSPGNGWFYVANYAGNTITVYDKDGARVATSGAGFRAPPAGTTNGPIGIAIVP